ncbi:MAG: cytochrome b5 domain-containing protein [Candidatus Nanopelagicales bacterium]
MFDLVNGLPVHALVVHAAVVLVPLTFVGVLVISVRRQWRKNLGWWVVGLAFAATFCSWAAKESGEALAARVGEPAQHAALGDTMPLFSAVMFVGVLLLVVVDRLVDRGQDAGTPLIIRILAVLAVVLSLVATVQVIRVGDSGAQAVWATRIAATQGDPLPEPESSASPLESPSTASSPGEPSQRPTIATPSPSPSQVPTTAEFTLADVQRHATPASCWVAIGSTVYDLTAWIRQHPGGAARIEQLCGKDASDSFSAQHGGQLEPTAALAMFEIGTLS